jgi:ADP-dependent NAD(P)H-hydrate dehydratase / NAD(P)H-hydrate epimerase
MQKVLTAEQMREVDRQTTEKYGIPSILLMENAAHAVARVITEKLGGSVKDKSILILCGKGNNGGDGAALARLLSLDGGDVDVVLFGKINEAKGDARTNFGVLCSEDFTYDDVYSSVFCEIREIGSKDEWNTFQLHHWYHADVVVDAIFGTGLTRPLEIWLYNVIHEINFLGEDRGPGRPGLYIAVDIPTGLNADSGEPLDIAFQSDVTITFTAPKAGNILPGAAGFNGELIVAAIGTEKELIDEQPSQMFLSVREDATDWMEKSRFANTSYKTKRGHALLIAGSESYSGAAVLCGNAAMRSGAGLVTIATPTSSKDSIASRVLPEVMVRGVAESESGAISEAAFDEIGDLLEKADAVAIGSGLSLDESTKKFVEAVIKTRRQPVVVDADALTLLSPFSEHTNELALTYVRATDTRVTGARVSSPHVSKGNVDDRSIQQFPLILTPHEGEFLRLLGTTSKDAIKNRVAAVRAFATNHNVILVLKGERVLIGEPGGKVVVNPTGNSGLGKAGNGDTLTGILVGFVAQAAQMKIGIFETVVAAVYVAGMAGDIAERKYGKRVMTASDVRECLVDVFARLEAE